MLAGIYAMEFNNLKKIDKFLEDYSLLRLNHEELENLNTQIDSRKSETIFSNPPKSKSPGQVGFTVKF